MKPLYLFLAFVGALATAGCVQCSDCVPEGFLNAAAAGLRANVSQERYPGKIRVEFGPVLLGTSVTETLLLTAAGGADVTIWSAKADLVAPDFAFDAHFPERLTDDGAPLAIPIHFTPATLGSKLGTLQLTTDSPISPTIELILTGEGVRDAKVWVSPQTIDFGVVATGEAASRPVTLSNNSGTTLSFVIGNIVGSGYQECSLSESAHIVTLDDGKSETLMVRFAPASAEPTRSRASFTVDHDAAPQNPSAPVVILSGQNFGLTFEQAVACGPVPVNGALTTTVTLLNSGPTVRLTSPPEVVAPNSPGTFAPGPGFPGSLDVVPAGGSLSFPIAFSPTQAGAFTASLEVATSDPVYPNLHFPLTCTAAIP